MDREQAVAEVGRLRNRHVAQLLDYLGDQPRYLQTAIRVQFSKLADDIVANLIDGGAEEYLRRKAEKEGGK
jgi:hypothetical protein